MHRLVIAGAAASVLALAGAAHAGWSGQYAGGYSSSPSCGCQGGYEEGGSYSYQSPYVDEDDGYSEGGYGYEGGDYVPYQPQASGYEGGYDYNHGYGYGHGNYGYGQRDYDYGHRDYGYQRDRGYEARPRYRSYSNTYDYDRTYRAPRSSGYRGYRYSAPHYSSPSYRYRSYGHSSTDGERG